MAARTEEVRTGGGANWGAETRALYRACLRALRGAACAIVGRRRLILQAHQLLAHRLQLANDSHPLGHEATIGAEQAAACVRREPAQCSAAT